MQYRVKILAVRRLLNSISSVICSDFQKRQNLPDKYLSPDNVVFSAITCQVCVAVFVPTTDPG